MTAAEQVQAVRDLHAKQDGEAWRPPAYMLRPTGIRVPDWPQPFRYALASNQARTFVPFIERGFSDDEAWEALFTDESRLSLFRSIHGNRKGPRRKPAQPSLFDAPVPRPARDVQGSEVVA